MLSTSGHAYSRDLATRHHRVWPFLILLCLAVPASAQIYNIFSYSEMDGLPSAAVTDVAQDSLGNIWLATRNGLVQYDGLSWQTTDGGQPLTTASISAMRLEPNGDIWAVSYISNKLVLREGGIWRELPLRGRQLFRTEIHQLLPLSRAGEARAALLLGASAGCYVVEGTECRGLALDDRLTWIAGAVLHEGVVHLATDQGLLLLRDPLGETHLEPAPGLPEGPVYAILPGRRAGTLEVVGQRWWAAWDGRQAEVHPWREAVLLPSASYGVTAVRDRDGSLFIGDQTRLYQVAPDGQTSCILSTRNGLAGNGATAIIIDRAGPIWFSSLRGVSKLDTRQLRGFDRRHGLLDDEVSAILLRERGPAILGHAGGLTLLTEPPRTISFTDLDPNTARVSDLLEDRRGQVWIAAGQAGVAHLQPPGEVRWLNDRLGLASAAYALAEDDAGVMWLGTERGLFQLAEDTLVPYRLVTDHEGSVPSIRRLVPAVGGGLWVCTGKSGLYRVDAAGATRYAGDSFQLSSVYNVAETADGRVYVATLAGLARVRGSSLVACGEPRIARAVYALAFDDLDRLWLGTDRGLKCWTGRSLEQFTARDGLLGQEANRDALVVTEQGFIWLGTDRGLNQLDVSAVADQGFAPPVRISAIDQAADPLPIGAPISLTGEAQELTFHFRSTPFRDERQLRFRTWLEGFDGGWRPAERIPTQMVRYTNLPPGSYRFHVQALASNDLAGAPAVSQLITIQPPLWRRAWFVAIEALAGLGLLALVVMAWQSRRYATRLETEVAARTYDLACSEDALRQESRRLASVLASISEAVLVVDDHGTVLMANPSAAWLTGLGVDQLEGVPLPDLFPDLPFDPAAPLDPAAYPVAYRYQPSSSAQARDLELAAAALTVQGDGGHGRVLAFRDVTDRRRLEQERIRAQKLESLGVLAGGLAHDFNNLMTVVLGHLSMLEATGIHDGEGLARMRAATEQARALTAQLLTFARGGAPRMEATELASVIERAGRLVCAGSSARVDIALDDDLPPAEADPGQLEQVFSNLFLNARQAMTEGGRIQVTGQVVDEGDARWLEIIVRDQGPGVARAVADQVFEPYFTSKDDGTGLGLTICYSIVSRHGGKIWLANPDQPGAAFHIRLPAAAPATQASELGLADASGEQIPLRTNLRVLLLDDDDAVRDIVQRLVERLDHRCEVAASAAAAIARFTAAKEDGQGFDLVIVDLILEGGMSGLSAFQRMREIDPAVRGIVASGYSSDPVMSDHRGHGFVAALTKPFDREALARALARAARSRD